MTKSTGVQTATAAGSTAPRGGLQSLRSIPRYQWYVTLTATTGFALTSMDNSFFTQALTPISNDLHLTSADVGHLTTAIYLTAGVVTYLVGLLVDFIGRRRAFQYTLIGTAVGCVLTAASWAFLPLVIFRAVSTAAGSAEGITGQTLVAENGTRGRRGLMMAVQQMGYPIGWFLSSGIALVVLPAWGWRALFLIGVVPAVIALASRRWVRESDRYVEVQRIKAEIASDPSPTGGGEAAASVVLADAAVVDTERVGHSPLRQIFERDLIRTTLVLFLGTLFFAIGSGTVLFFLPYLLDAHHLSTSHLNRLIAIGTLGGVVGYLLLGHLGDVFGRKWTVVVGLLLGSLSIYGLSQVNSFGTLVVAEVCFWAFYMGAYAALYGLMTESFPTRARGTGVGFVTSSVYIGNALCGELVPHFFNWMSVDAAFVVAGTVPGVLAAITFATTRNIRADAELEEIVR